MQNTLSLATLLGMRGAPLSCDSKRTLSVLRFLFLSLVVLLSAFLFRDSFHAYFFQDDWFSFSISSVSHFREFLEFIIPRPDVIYYRPLGMQIPFFLVSLLFGISPLAFHILTFLTHSIAIVFVYFLSKEITGMKGAGLLSAFFYGTSLVHYIPFFWSSTYAFVLGPAFFFSSFFFFLLSVNRIPTVNGWTAQYISSCLLFLFGILTNEMVFSLPGIFFFYLLFFSRLSQWRLLIPYLVLAFSVFSLRLILPPSFAGAYSVDFGKHILTNIEGYLLWSFQWPEEMKAQLINFYTINPQFISDFSVYFRTFALSLLILFFLFFLPVSVVFVTQGKARRLFFFGFSWYLVGLSPVLLFPSHAFSYYLPISLVGGLVSCVPLFCSFLLRLRVGRSIARSLFSFFLLLVLFETWVFVGSRAIDFNTTVHWAPRRARLAERLVSRARRVEGQPDAVMQIFVLNQSEYILALNDQDAFRVLFGENTKTRYVFSGGADGSVSVISP